MFRLYRICSVAQLVCYWHTTTTVKHIVPTSVCICCCFISRRVKILFPLSVFLPLAGWEKD